jgi:hypothetical protein
MQTSLSPSAPPPQAIVMQMVMGAWVSQTISSVTRLNVPDILQAHGPLTARQLTDNHGVNAQPAFLERALRACASVGIFTEDPDGRFGPTPLSEVLTLGSPASVKKLTEVFGGTWWRIWTGLPEALQTGRPQAKAQLGMEYWDYCKANPEEMEDFGEAMKSNSLSSMHGVLEHCDFSEVQTVIDVGGGFGHMAISLLRRYPHLRASVLDLPDLMPIAEKQAAGEDPDILARLSFVGRDMFADVPPGNAYILKHIIHDWDDASCIQVLKNCRARMQGNGRIYCVDAVLPPIGDTSGTAAKFLDIDMMVFVPGKERTEAEWRSLYEVAGLELIAITALNDNFGTSIVEGVKH